nr:hypothetical protein [Tanacetum cinerariifolium]
MSANNREKKAKHLGAGRLRIGCYYLVPRAYLTAGTITRNRTLPEFIQCATTIQRGTDDEGSLGGAQAISAEEQAAIDDTNDTLSAQMEQFRVRKPDYFLP